MPVIELKVRLGFKGPRIEDKDKYYPENECDGKDYVFYFQDHVKAYAQYRRYKDAGVPCSIGELGIFCDHLVPWSVQ